MSTRATSAGRFEDGPARPEQVEAVFPEALEALSSAIREIAELRREVTRLRASIHLHLLSGGDFTQARTDVSESADSWVSPRARPRPTVGSLQYAREFTAADDRGFDWSAWIQRLPPVTARSEPTAPVRAASDEPRELN